MPIKEIRHDYLGAEFGLAICSHCVTPSRGWTVLKPEYHNGYGEDATKATEEQMQSVLHSALTHVKDHPDHGVRVIYGHKEDRRGEDGNSLTIYTYPKK